MPTKFGQVRICLLSPVR